MAKINNNLKNVLRSSFGSTAATLLSRFLGLFRVMLEARVLGGGALASSWHLAFMIPNFCRRIFGEGALAQALIPILSHTEAELGIEEVKKQLALVLTFLTGILSALTLIISLAAILAAEFWAAGHIKDALLLLPILMPYSIFICLVGVMTAVANTRRVFFRAALNALILNIVLITVLFAAQKFVWGSGKSLLYVLSCSVLGSGVLQLLHLAHLLRQNNIFPLFHKGLTPPSKVLKELFRLALPGIIGGIAVHCSFMIDRTLACFVGDYAVPALNNTERLVLLPVGLVAVALASVLMADMSRAAANKKFEEMRSFLAMGLRYVWFICIPLALFMICYRTAIIRFFFKYGNFTEHHVAATADTLLFYAMGIPAFCAIKVILPAFYARKKMTLPLKISIFCIILNIPLSILLMFKLKQGGIAFATALSSMCHTILLLYCLKRENFAPQFSPIAATMLRSLLFAAAAVYPALHYAQIAQWCQSFTIASIPDAVPLAVCALFFAVVYLLLSLIARAPEPREIYLSLFCRSKKEKGE